MRQAQNCARYRLIRTDPKMNRMLLLVDRKTRSDCEDVYTYMVFPFHCLGLALFVHRFRKLVRDDCFKLCVCLHILREKKVPLPLFFFLNEKN